MADKFIPFALPDIGSQEIEAVTEVLRSGWVTTGAKTKQFELDFSNYLGGAGEAIAVNSATAGLHLALEALGVGPGDEVITSTLTFTATAEVVRYLGADVILVDVDPVTLNISPEEVRKAITPKTKAIIPVHYGGLACDMRSIMTIARENGLKVVEDAAHALPTTFEGKLIGSLETDATVFSFYANKTMTTGEGGMVVTSDSALAARMKVMRLHGISRDAFDRFTSRTPAWYYEIVAPGFKYNLTDIASAMGVTQLARLADFAERREMLAERYFEGLGRLPLILPAKPDGMDKHAWHLYVVRLNDEVQSHGVSRDAVIEHLANCGVGTSVHYVPLHRQPYWRDRYGLRPEMFPVADNAYSSMFSLPLYTRLTDAQQDQVVEALRGILVSC